MSSLSLLTSVLHPLLSTAVSSLSISTMWGPPLFAALSITHKQTAKNNYSQLVAMNKRSIYSEVHVGTLCEMSGHWSGMSGVSLPSGRVVSWFLRRFKSLRHSSWPSSAGKLCSSLQLTSWHRKTQRKEKRTKRFMIMTCVITSELDLVISCFKTQNMDFWLWSTCLY